MVDNTQQSSRGWLPTGIKQSQGWSFPSAKFKAFGKHTVSNAGSWLGRNRPLTGAGQTTPPQAPGWAKYPVVPIVAQFDAPKNFMAMSFNPHQEPRNSAIGTSDIMTGSSMGPLAASRGGSGSGTISPYSDHITAGGAWQDISAIGSHPPANTNWTGINSLGNPNPFRGGPAGAFGGITPSVSTGFPVPPMTPRPGLAKAPRQKILDIFRRG